MTELALELKKMGHDVTVFTSTPHYNKDSEARNSQPLRRRWGSILYQSNCQGIPVYHARIPNKGSRVRARLFDYIRFHAISTVAGLSLAGNYDVVLAPSPPLTIGFSAWILALARRASVIYNVQEIYPDIAVKLGVLRNRGVIWLMEALERFIYAHSRAIVVISKEFRRRLLAKNVPDKRIRVIPNFVDTDFICPGARQNSFAKAHGLEKKFVVLYAGNIGLSQNFENILSAARRLAYLSDLCLLIVGNGARRSWLEKQLEQQEISTVKLLPYQSRGLVPQIYASSDVCLVPLKGGTAQATFPSKIYTIMAAGRPVIVAADNDSELALIPKESGCGWSVPPDDDLALEKAIKHAYDQRANLEQKGQLGRKYVVAHPSRQAVARQYDALIRDIVKA